MPLLFPLANKQTATISGVCYEELDENPSSNEEKTRDDAFVSQAFSDLFSNMDTFIFKSTVCI